MESTNKSTNNIEKFRNIIASNPPTSDEYYFIQIIKYNVYLQTNN